MIYGLQTDNWGLMGVELGPFLIVCLPAGVVNGHYTNSGKGANITRASVHYRSERKQFFCKKYNEANQYRRRCPTSYVAECCREVQASY